MFKLVTGFRDADCGTDSARIENISRPSAPELLIMVKQGQRAMILV